MARRASLLIIAIALLSGCGRPAPPVRPAAPKAALDVYTPCLLSIPIQRVVGRFQASHPGSEVSVLVDKPLAQIEEVRSAANASGVAITLGEIEMGTLIGAGVVSKQDVRPFATSTSPIVAVAPAASGSPEGGSLRELGSPSVRRVLIEDPARSSLGDRATRGLKEAGLWPAVSAKVVRPEASAMILAELLSGKAEAALVLKGCLLAEKGPGGASPATSRAPAGKTVPRIPKTIRIVGELAPDSYPPIVHMAAPLARGKDAALAKEFVAFLASPEGRKAVADAGLTSVDRTGR
ncbi:MAG: molybdate ABC transporter substrate-binding protein [Armatimonadota bacterium]